MGQNNWRQTKPRLIESMKATTKFVLALFHAVIIQLALAPPTFAAARHDRATVVAEYRVEYKLRNPKTGSTGEAHVTFMRAKSEANVLAELRRQHPGRNVVILSLATQ